MNQESLPIIEDVPWYRKKAERPKSNATFNIFQDHKNKLENDYNGRQSSLTRYIMDCFFKGRIATPTGFDLWQQNGEKFK
jgi:hypothetical protein